MLTSRPVDLFEPPARSFALEFRREYFHLGCCQCRAGQRQRHRGPGGVVERASGSHACARYRQRRRLRSEFAGPRQPAGSSRTPTNGFRCPRTGRAPDPA